MPVMQADWKKTVSKAIRNRTLWHHYITFYSTPVSSENRDANTVNSCTQIGLPFLHWRRLTRVTEVTWYHWTTCVSKVSNADIAVRNWRSREIACHTGSHSVASHPTAVTFPAFTQAEPVTRFSDPGPDGYKAELTHQRRSPIRSNQAQSWLRVVPSSVLATRQPSHLRPPSYGTG